MGAHMGRRLCLGAVPVSAATASALGGADCPHLCKAVGGGQKRPVVGFLFLYSYKCDDPPTMDRASTAGVAAAGSLIARDLRQPRRLSRYY